MVGCLKDRVGCASILVLLRDMIETAGKYILWRASSTLLPSIGGVLKSRKRSRHYPNVRILLMLYLRQQGYLSTHDSRCEKSGIKNKKCCSIEGMSHEARSMEWTLVAMRQPNDFSCSSVIPQGSFPSPVTRAQPCLSSMLQRLEVPINGNTYRARTRTWGREF
jgi:hypothetical protein